jgi:hypothetical protein
LQAEQLRHYLRSVVLPFSAHYQKVFQEHGLTADSIRTLEDLQKIPFTTKADLLNTPEHPQRARDFILAPDPKALARRPSTVLRALLHGRGAVKQELESEFRPIFMTFTTGRSAEPTPIFFSQRDLTHLATAARPLGGVGLHAGQIGRANATRAAPGVLAGPLRGHLRGC